MISVIIFTKNEASDLGACLDNLNWSDDIHVMDSMSTDNTIKIAKKYKAKLTQRNYGNNSTPFGGDEAEHRNWALKNISFKYDWVYHCDADERVTKELAEAMSIAVTNNTFNHSAFRVQRRDYLMGTWLKHVTPSPFNIRLFKVDSISYERAINPVAIVKGSVGEINQYFEHYSFSKGITHWINKHNIYSSLEAKQIIYDRKNKQSFELLKVFFEKDINIKRFHQKELFYRLPFRPLLKFILLYIFKRGFLDGKAGFTYAVLQSIYEYFIVLKTRELESISNQK